MFRRVVLAVMMAMTVSFALSGCSKEERREIRRHEERIAAEQARQQRLAAQYATDVAAETQRRKDLESAETAREWNRGLKVLGEVVAFLAAIGGVLAFALYSIRRLGERHLAERTKRHAENLKAIQADPNLRPEDRKALYGAAIDAANRGGTPLLGTS